MKKLTIFLAALMLGLTFASAADEKHDRTAVFKKYDKNGDGFLSLEEFKAMPRAEKHPARAEEIFKKRDTNGDGKLSLEEFLAPRAKKGTKSTST